MKKLEMYGVQEMNAKEMKETDGGGWFGILAGAVIIALTLEVMFEGSAKCWADFQAGYQSTQ